MIKLGFVGGPEHFLKVGESCKNMIGLQKMSFFNHYKSAIFENNQQMKNIAYDDFILKCDALYFFEDPSLNFSLVEKALKQTKHCYLESPRYFSNDDVKKIKKIQGETKSTLVIGEISQQIFKNVKEELSLHPPFIFHVTHSEDKDLMEMLLTDIDFIVQFVNSDLRKAEALGLPMTGNPLNVINSNLYFSNGSVASLILQKKNVSQIHQLSIYAQNGVANLDFLRKEIKYNGQTYLSHNKKLDNNNANYLSGNIKLFIRNLLENSKNEISNEKNLSAIDIKDLVRNKIKRSLSA